MRVYIAGECYRLDSMWQITLHVQAIKHDSNLVKQIVFVLSDYPLLTSRRTIMYIGALFVEYNNTRLR